MDCVMRDSNKVMLVKIPEALYEQMKRAPDTTGTLFFDPISKAMKFEFSELGEETLKFKAEISPADDDLHIFSVDGGRKAVLKAKVAYKGNLLPEKSSIFDKQNQEIMKKISDYSIQTCDAKIDNKNQKRILKLHDDHKSYIMANSDQAHQANIRKKYKEKRVRGDPEKVRTMLFELFAGQSYWKTKALADETSQPESFLNEILQEIADKVPSGQYRGHWRLKPQFREADDNEESDLIRKN